MNLKPYLSNLTYALRVYDYKIFIFLIIIWIVLTTIPNGFIPDYLNLGNLISSGVFVSFIRIVIPFVGFIIGFLTLALGILRERFRRQALNELISSFYLKHILTTSIGLIFILLLTHFQINYDQPNYTDLNIGYFSIILSLAYLILLFPLLILSIASIDSNHAIRRFVEKIEPEHFEDRASLMMGFDEANPIIILKNLLAYSIDRDDKPALHLIIYGTSERVLDMMDQNTPRETINNYFDGLLLIWEELVERSIKQNTPSHISDVYYLFELYNQRFVEKQIQLLYLDKMINFIHDTSEKVPNIGNPNLLRKSLHSLEKVLDFHFRHAPNEKDIPDMQHLYQDEFITKYGNLHGNRRPPFFGWNHDLEWEKVSHSIPWTYSVILERIVECENYTFFRETISWINTLISIVIKSSLGSFQKEELIRVLTSIIFTANRNAIKSHLIRSPEEMKSLSTFSLNEIIENEEDYIRTIISSYFEFIWHLHNKRILLFNRHFDDIIGTLGRYCANAYDHNKTAKRTFDFLLKGVEKLKIEIETELDHNIENYIYLKTTLEDFKKWHLKELWKNQDITKPEKPNSSPDKKLIKRIEKILKSFKQVNAVNQNSFLSRKAY